ncbi:UNVERIFIED_CONTAM: hypothetical protein PYX00_011684 [Menopon gallinae]|uniref:Ubiquitin-related modifier 1 n=1 Tax=Menopon gallinae TaxID=328185 RepID=A0AAW2H841_9NEOP
MLRKETDAPMIVEFTSGAEMYFDTPVLTISDKEMEVQNIRDMHSVISYLYQRHEKSRGTLFREDLSLAPGILCCIDEVDWEILGRDQATVREQKYIVIEGQRPVFSGWYAKYLPRSRVFYKRCMLKVATHILVTDQYGRKSIVDIKLVKCTSEKLKRFVCDGHVRFVEIQYSSYVYDTIAEKYVQPALDFNLASMTLREALARAKDDTGEAKLLYGRNEFNIRTRSLLRIVYDNVASFLSAINAISIMNYYLTGYYMYATIILVITIYQLVNDIYSETISERGLMEMAKKVKYVKVLSRGRWVETSSSNVYPGSIMLIESFRDFPCDCKILKGEVVVDESFLTGESIPVTKSPDGNNLVFAGTTVLKSKGSEVDVDAIRNGVSVSDKVVRVKNLIKIKQRPSTECIPAASSEESTNSYDTAAFLENADTDQGIHSVSGGGAARAECSDASRAQEDSREDQVLGANARGRGTKLDGVHGSLILKKGGHAHSSARDEGKPVHESVMDPPMANSTQHQAIGLVIATGFETTKGKLLRSILIPRPPTFQFYREARAIVIFLAAAGALMSCLLFLYFCNLSPNFTFCNLYALGIALDMFFVVLSPSLLTAILFGASIAQKRLKSAGIFCYDKERINSAGQVDLVLFDKTGTITEEGLDVHVIDDLNKTYGRVQECSELVRLGISVCHSAVMIGEEVVGDPLDTKMFKFSMATMEENKKEIGIHGDAAGGSGSARVMKLLEFDNRLRRMSAMVEYGTRRILFTKGSPESIKPLLAAPPASYDENVREYALDGYRVIALAYKELGADEAGGEGSADRSQDSAGVECTRAVLEDGLGFLALVVFANKPKPVSSFVISELNRAGIKTLMATGDNILTAVSVAREVGLVDEMCPVLFPVLSEEATNIFDTEWMCIGNEEFIFDKIRLMLYKGRDKVSYTEFVIAIEGREYEFFREEKTYSEFILEKAVVFSRMNPDQKKMLVEDLTEKGYVTAFCGDGANDCGALKSAEVGIALARNEASVVSSFTSKVMDISSVISVIREGRAALVGSISRFKFILLAIMTQLGGLLILSFLMQFLSDFQTIHFDVFSVLALTFVMSEFKSARKLSSSEVKPTLMDSGSIVLFLGHTAIQFLFSLATVLFFRSSPGTFNKFATESELDTAMFFVSCFQVYTLGLIVAEGSPHRESKLRKKTFVGVWLLLVVYTGVLLLSNQGGSFSLPYLAEKYELVAFRRRYSMLALVALVAANTLCTVCLWHFVKSWRSKESKVEHSDEIWDELEH